MKKLIITGVIIAAIAAVGFSLYGFFNSLNSQRVQYETSLTASYQKNQTELDTYVKQIKEAVGIANLKSDKLDQVLRNAVSGRYGDSNAAGNRQGQGGAFFSAIVEAYPDIRGQLDLYDRIAERVFSGREAFKQKQNALLGEVQAYEVWMNDGLVQSIMIKRVIGAPTDLLQARIGTKVLRGQAALDQIRLVVTSKGTNESFESGQEEAIDFGGKKN
ncbi:MAG: hypothetical protein BWY75_00843 [bacterium ADurb.Bin425]|jgi:hypothetical protein|nr:MAG: hypothetical protein BWY75_00843 [bacterium ADurb.Bin425]